MHKGKIHLYLKSVEKHRKPILDAEKMFLDSHGLHFFKFKNFYVYTPIKRKDLGHAPIAIEKFDSHVPRKVTYAVQYQDKKKRKTVSL